MITERIALIDGDILLYETCFGSKLSPEESTRTGFSTSNASSTKEEKEDQTKSLEETYELFDDKMRNLQEKTGCTHYMGWLSPTTKDGFRSKIAFSLPYKGNRKDKELPPYYQELKTYMKERWGFVQLDSIETDDAITTWHTYYYRHDTIEAKACSKDKDIKQSPGVHYDWSNDLHDIILPKEGWTRLWKQMLTGDGIDNILGCANKVKKVYKTGAKKGEEYMSRVGIGPKKADEILESVKSNQFPARVLVEYISMFGIRLGIARYSEAFQLLHLFRNTDDVSLLSEEDMTKLIGTKYVFKDMLNSNHMEEDEEDEF